MLHQHNEKQIRLIFFRLPQETEQPLHFQARNLGIPFEIFHEFEIVQKFSLSRRPAERLYWFSSDPEDLRKIDVSGTRDHLIAVVLEKRPTWLLDFFSRGGSAAIRFPMTDVELNVKLRLIAGLPIDDYVATDAK